MKLARLGGMVLGVVLGGIAGILLTTNPNRQDYEQYASQRLTSYLKDNVCARAQASPEVQALLRGYCKMLVDTGHPFLQEAITTNTSRKNFLIFSVYQTELSFPPPLPSYQFSSVGFLNKLYIYEALEL
ncbi:hypothetical protein myaer87_27210 [Microcystis aeruginosa NIES-87]|uniref:DUF4359 domain-containing protein n=1 Tax=Microcystis TaxID=1125 RepID=UPI000CC9A91E|nr:MULTISPECIES: DUF4359 domain-containing protein [Microcystis]MCA2716236.1 DUF4359 domain-containing protein [Microcystis sp. M169S2]WNF16203.1 DUF4359 domain-containing protein [Microcystis aeruginosa NRERC-214]GBE75494.1 hypothetical protein myaer87_27210 [Microcystis aeruginosa NIES-87]